MGRQARDQRHVTPLVRRLAEEDPTRAQHAGHLREHGRRDRQMLQDVVGEDHVEAGIRIGDRLSQAHLTLVQVGMSLF